MLSLLFLENFVGLFCWFVVTEFVKTLEVYTPRLITLPLQKTGVAGIKDGFIFIPTSPSFSTVYRIFIAAHSASEL